MTPSIHNINELPLLPGRLGDPNRVLKTDPAPIRAWSPPAPPLPSTLLPHPCRSLRTRPCRTSSPTVRPTRRAWKPCLLPCSRTSHR